MNISEFNTFKISTRANLLWELGVFFKERVIYGKFIYKLYSVNNFYVEVEYSVSSNEILSIVAYEPMELADSYVKRRDLDYAFDE